MLYITLLNCTLNNCQGDKFYVTHFLTVLKEGNRDALWVLAAVGKKGGVFLGSWAPGGEGWFGLKAPPFHSSSTRPHSPSGHRIIPSLPHRPVHISPAARTRRVSLPSLRSPGCSVLRLLPPIQAHQEGASPNPSAQLARLSGGREGEARCGHGPSCRL